jgi:hypothetical protein
VVPFETSQYVLPKIYCFKETAALVTNHIELLKQDAKWSLAGSQMKASDEKI